MLNRWQAITWTNSDPVHWPIYASRGLYVVFPGKILKFVDNWEEKQFFETYDDLAPCRPQSIT